MQPEAPPLPVSATLTIGTGVLVVTFDRLLQPGALAAANWIATADIGAGARAFTPLIPPSALAFDVTWLINDIGPGLGGPLVSYSPPPFDVIGLNALPAPAFVNFPMAVVP